MPFAIGLDRPKHDQNLGTVMRSCYNFGASLIFTIGNRYQRTASDTTNTGKHIPIMNFKSWSEYKEHALGWQHIGVEITDESFSLPSICHPDNAVYILGPEDGSISKEALKLCKYTVSIPSKRCLNLAVAASIVMYDRIAKNA